MIISNSRITVLNRATGEEIAFPLVRSRLAVGRGRNLQVMEDPNDKSTARLTVPSGFISSEHLVLDRESGGHWHTTVVGSTPVFLNGQPLAPGGSAVIAAGDTLDLGEFTASIFETEVAPLKATAATDANALLSAVEARIHGALLEAMELRRADRTLDLESEKIQRQILDHLDTLISWEITQLEPREVSRFARLALYRLLTYAVTSAGATVLNSRSAELAESRGGRLTKAEVERVMGVLTRTLGLELLPRTFSKDLARIDEGFNRAANVAEAAAGPALLADTIAFYLRRAILDLIYGLGPLQDLMEMESISEIMVVARDQIFVEKFGVVENSRRSFYSDDSLLAVIERIVAPVGRRIDKSSPMVDAHLHDGSRVNAIIPPLALKGPCLTIRKFRKTPLTMDDLVRFGALSQTMCDFLKSCVEGRKNIVVSGGTGSGKTTMLNCLSAFIGAKERIVTVEDTAELQLSQEHVVTLEGRPSNMEGKGEVSIRDLVRNALRMRPDRVIVGECRGAEALDMLQAMNTGHDGSMTTGHANSPQDMMRRLETLVLTGVDMPISAVREQIASAVHVVVQVQRSSDGQRRVTHIAEVIGIDPGSGSIIVEDIFRYAGGSGDQSRDAQHTGYLPTFTEELIHKGVLGLGLFLQGGAL